MVAGANKDQLEAICDELSYRKSRKARQLATKVAFYAKALAFPIAPSQSGTRPTHLNPSPKSIEQGIHFTPTDEQFHAIEAFKDAKTLKINALAGTGKTSTLRLIAENNSKRGVYLAFNRQIALESSRTFPPNVKCHTIHSVAADYIRKKTRLSDEKMFGEIGPKNLQQLIGLKGLTLAEEVYLSGEQQAHLISRTVRNYCYSSNQDLSPAHVPQLDILLSAPKISRLAVNQWAADQAAILWNRMLDPSDPIPLGHDGYLKLWALSKPVFECEYVLVDEAQDTNPVAL